MANRGKEHISLSQGKEPTLGQFFENFKVTLAACLGQYEVTPASEGGARYLYEVMDSELPTQFLKAYARMGLHENAGGLGVRQWQHYAEPAFVGMVTRSWQSSIVPVATDDSGGGMTAFPALEELLQQAQGPTCIRILVVRLLARSSSTSTAVGSSYYSCRSSIKLFEYSAEYMYQ